MTPIEWAACVNVLRHAYGSSFRLDEAGVAVWYELLSDLDGQRVIAAVRHMCQTQKAFPAVADVRRLAAAPLESPEETWSQLCRQVMAEGTAGRYVAPPDALVYENGKIVGRLAEGRVEFAELPASTAKALEAVGGRAAILEAESPTALRILGSTFCKVLSSARERDAAHDELPAPSKLVQLDGAARRIGRALPPGGL